jgi:hypothetical protein
MLMLMLMLASDAADADAARAARSSSNIFYACRGHVETVRACGCYNYLSRAVLV